jgi:hypothetical protein
MRGRTGQISRCKVSARSGVLLFYDFGGAIVRESFVAPRVRLRSHNRIAPVKEESPLLPQPCPGVPSPIKFPQPRRHETLTGGGALW